jgi:hypothetical protein
MTNLLAIARHRFIRLVIFSLLALVHGPRADAQPQSAGDSSAGAVLTSADVSRDLQLGESPDRIILRVRRHRTAFTNLDGLFAAIRATATPETAVNLEQLTLEIAASVARGGIPAPTGDVASAMSSKYGPAPAPPAKTPPPYSDERLAQARGVGRLGNVTPYQWTCDSPVPPKDPLKPHNPLPTFEFYWKTGTSLPSDINKSAIYCIELRPEFNDILFNPEFTLTALPSQGTAFDLLKDAVNALTNLPFGGSTDTKSTKEARPTCPADLPAHITSAVNAGAALQDALTQIDPGKDSNGKTIYVERSITIGRWPNIQHAYGTFEDAVATLVADLQSQHAGDCDKERVLARAIAVAVDSFGPAKKAYTALLVHASETDATVRFTTPLESTSNYDATVKPTYGGGDTNAVTKTVRFSAGHQLLTASAGILITELPARSYSSKTAPAGTNNSTTQNVLGIDYGRGPRPALAALLNFHPPVSWLDRKQFGIGLSGGPVFDVSNGKADTSRFGFFGGVSLRLGEYVYLTPGVHVGEFADFPQGFTAPGQIIPPNFGTPAGVKRYTARFAFGVTIKLRSILEAPTKAPADTAASGAKTGSAGGKP